MKFKLIKRIESTFKPIAHAQRKHFVLTSKQSKYKILLAMVDSERNYFGAEILNLL